MPRKNLALEVALIVCALVGAFVVQSIISHTKPPNMREFGASTEGGENDQIEEDSNDAELGRSSDNIRTVPKVYLAHLSSLGVAPDWSMLDDYQYVICKTEFVRLISEVYSVDDYWKDWFQIHEDHVMIRMQADDPSKLFKLFFRNEIVSAEPQRYWRSKGELVTHSNTAPLLGLHIAIDPGHIGGQYAQIEQRNFVLAEGAPPIQEGSMTLTVAELLVPQLEALGAIVSLVRDKTEPVNPFRTEDYFAYAKSKRVALKSVVTEESVKREAQKLFYRNGEIRARADVINNELKPDLVLCIHFNADPQTDPDRPELFKEEHFHMILNGAYTKSEMAHDDERFKCVLKIVQGNHAEEQRMAAAVAASFVQETGMKPYMYSAKSSRATKIANNNYLWARNLIANRLYDCPVLYFEPYLMNGKDSYIRMQMGDYPDLRYVNGKLRLSIYREYVAAVTKGLVAYYTSTEPEEEKVEQPDALEDLLEDESATDGGESRPELEMEVQ